MEIVRIPRIMQDTSRTLVMRGRHVGFVPTMGALHDGHMSLVRAARQENDATAVSIFVNPRQFGRGEDFERYPRDVEADIKRLGDAGVDIVFLPEPDAMYPEGFDAWAEVPALSGKLCGPFRPGHFRGVATVVVKLLNIVLPKRAYFGLKDYQQFAIIRKLARDLNVPAEVVPCPTVREADGLAMSSRNRSLSTEERGAAKAIYRALSEAAEMLKTKGATAEEAVHAMQKALASEPLVASVDYAGAYDPDTLDPLAGRCPFKEGDRRCSALLACAVRIGTTRLIDNVLL